MSSRPPYPAEPLQLFWERRAVPWWWWVVAMLLVVPSVEAVVVIGPEMSSHGSLALAIGCFVITVTAVAAFLLALSRSTVEVDEFGLHAGGVSLPGSSIGIVRALDAENARRVLGRDARADAHLSLRPWVHTAVQIEVDETSDPTPYWVVATRRPHELVAVLRTLHDGWVIEQSRG